MGLQRVTFKKSVFYLKPAAYFWFFMLEKQTLKGQLLFFQPSKGDVQNKRQPQKKLKQNSFSRCQSKNKKKRTKNTKRHILIFILGFLLEFKAGLEIGVRKKSSKKSKVTVQKLISLRHKIFQLCLTHTFQEVDGLVRFSIQNRKRLFN